MYSMGLCRLFSLVISLVTIEANGDQIPPQCDINSNANNYTFVGCYDTPSTDSNTYNNNWTAEGCMQTCIEHGSSFVGIENPSICRCSESIDIFETYNLVIHAGDTIHCNNIGKAALYHSGYILNMSVCGYPGIQPSMGCSFLNNTRQCLKMCENYTTFLIVTNEERRKDCACTNESISNIIAPLYVEVINNNQTCMENALSVCYSFHRCYVHLSNDTFDFISSSVADCLEYCLYVGRTFVGIEHSNHCRCEHDISVFPDQTCNSSYNGQLYIKESFNITNVCTERTPSLCPHYVYTNCSDHCKKFDNVSITNSTSGSGQHICDCNSYNLQHNRKEITVSMDVDNCTHSRMEIYQVIKLRYNSTYNGSVSSTYGFSTEKITIPDKSVSVTTATFFMTTENRRTSEHKTSGLSTTVTSRSTMDSSTESTPESVFVTTEEILLTTEDRDTSEHKTSGLRTTVTPRNTVDSSTESTPEPVFVTTEDRSSSEHKTSGLSTTVTLSTESIPDYVPVTTEETVVTSKEKSKSEYTTFGLSTIFTSRNNKGSRTESTLESVSVTSGEILVTTEDRSTSEHTIVGLRTTLTSKNTADSITDIPISGTTGIHCQCPCYNVGSKWIYPQNMTKEELEVYLKEELAELRRNLSVDPKQTSAYKNTKISASDSRPSSAAVGSVGILLITFILGLIICSDITTLIRSRSWSPTKQQQSHCIQTVEENHKVLQ